MLDKWIAHAPDRLQPQATNTMQQPKETLEYSCFPQIFPAPCAKLQPAETLRHFPDFNNRKSPCKGPEFLTGKGP